MTDDQRTSPRAADRPDHSSRDSGISVRMVRPWAILAASLMVALAVYLGFLGSAWMDVVARWTASWTSFTLNLLGSATRADGTLLLSDSFTANIVSECTAVGPLVLFAGAVLAYPASLRAKGLGVLTGIVVLTGANLVRIMSLFWIGSTYPQYLDVAHLLVWQAGIILLAIVVWLFWVERVGARAH